MARPQAGTFGNESPVVAVDGDIVDRHDIKGRPLHPSRHDQGPLAIANSGEISSNSPGVILLFCGADSTRGD
jgi:hypothetical protein